MNIAKTNMLTLDNYYSQKKQNETTESKFTIENTREKMHSGKKSVIPENAPQSIKDAWNELTQDEKFSISRNIIISTAEANMRIDKDGRYFRIEEGNPNYVENIMHSDDFKIDQFIHSWISRNQKNMNLFPNEREQHLKNISVLQKFKQLIQKDHLGV